MYAGNTGSNYANPDAVTQIGSGTATSTYAYDNNGNVTTAGGTTNTWNYLNQLTQSVTASSTGTYAYDYNGNRVKYTVGGITSYYPNKFYTLTGTTTEKDIFAGDQLVAMISNKVGSTSTYWLHPDYLGSTNVITASTGTSVESTTYYPYGSILTDKTNSAFGENRKYIGQQYDGNTQLNYLNARYQDPARGQFLSEDPVFLGNPSGQTLTNPQGLNSYSYANDNPITYSDPSGRLVPLIIAAFEVLDEAYTAYSAYSSVKATVDLSQQLLDPNNHATADERSQTAGEVFQDGSTAAIGRFAGIFGKKYTYLVDGLSAAGDILKSVLGSASISGVNNSNSINSRGSSQSSPAANQSSPSNGSTFSSYTSGNSQGSHSLTSSYSSTVGHITTTTTAVTVFTGGKSVTTVTTTSVRH